MAARKAEIQGKLWAVLGLNVDKPKSNGSDSTNNGNTARRTFLNTDTFASIVGFDREVLKNFHIILITISCNFEIDVDKFKNFCFKTASRYVYVFCFIGQCLIWGGKEGVVRTDQRHCIY